MALGDLYIFEVEQELHGQKVLNVFTYRQNLALINNSGNPNAQEFVSKWKTVVLPEWRTCVNVDLRFRKLTMRNHFDPTDYYSEDINLPGLRGQNGESLPAFAAIGVRYETGNLAVKDGAKRFAGVDEGGQEDGVFTDAGLLGQLNSFMGALAAPISPTLLGVDPIFLPIIVRRIRTGTQGNYEYTFPENQGAMVYSRVVTILYNLLVTTQVSRKVGIGE